MGKQTISKALIDELEKDGSTIASRFESMKCITFDPSNGQRRGNFSLVFRCYDKTNQTNALLKFMDPDCREPYRIDAFSREAKILSKLQNTKRCLQIIEGERDFLLPLKMGDGNTTEIPCKYFVIEWLQGEIEDFFLNQQSIETIDKIQIFKEILLATETLHRLGISHRDLKPDNYRSEDIDGNNNIKAVDLGTALHPEIPSLLPTYNGQVGHQYYASPEAMLGFAGDRDLAKYTDYFALGCMLFELFNMDYFFIHYYNTQANHALNAIANNLCLKKSESERRKELLIALNTFKHSVNIPSIGINQNNAPKSIQRMLDQILSLLTNFDYRYRVENLRLLDSKIETIKIILKNHHVQQERIEARKIRRKLREEKLKRKQLNNTQ